MLRSLHTFLVLVTIFGSTQLSFSHGSNAGRKPNDHAGSRIRLHLGPVIGFYKVNPHVATDVTQRFSAMIGLNKEFRLGSDYQTFLLVGADYLHYGMNFNSYYFPPGSLKIYNKSFDYRYSLSINELNFPIQFKYLFKPENNSLFSPYLAVAYHLRLFVPANLDIEQEGTFIKADKPEMKFKTPLIWDQVNAAVSLSAGWQKNILSNSRGSFFVELNYRYNFSQYYFETDYAPSSLYMNGSQLSLMLGIKF